MAADSGTEVVDRFMLDFKHYKQRLPPPTLSDVLDFENVNEKHFEPSVTENSRGQSGSSTCSPSLDNSIMVSKITGNDSRRIFPLTKSSDTSDSSNKLDKESSHKKPTFGSFSVVWDCLKSQGISEQTTDIIMDSWSDSTKSQYRTYFKKWLSFCVEREIDPTTISVNNLLMFLTWLYDNGLKYSGINTAKSAISSFWALKTDNLPIGENILIKRFMKGVFKQRPALPKYSNIWHVNIVLKYLMTLSPVNTLSLRFLSLKLVMLLALLSGQRAQTLHLIDIRNVQFLDNDALLKIPIGDILKQTKPGKHLHPIEIQKYSLNPALCAVLAMHEYIDRTSAIRKGNTQLFLSTVSPHRPIKKSTISSWVKTVMNYAGIDTNVYSAHSTRAAATSAAHISSTPINILLKTAGWSSDCVFRQFYNKPVSVNCQQGRFSKQLLDQFGPGK